MIGPKTISEERRIQLRDADARYFKKNREKILIRRRKRYLENRENILLAAANYYKENREKERERIRIYRDTRREKTNANQKKWREENRERWLSSQNRHYAKTKNLPEEILNSRMSSVMNHCLRGNKAGRKWEDLAGYTREKLRAHIEKKFLPGMSWENRGDWDIDHIIPLAAFNFQTPEDMDFKKAWALKNLRPLWSGTNRSKRAKLERPFQPSLTI